MRRAAAAALLSAAGAGGCAMARPGASMPDDAVHARARRGAPDPLPGDIDTANNTFAHPGLLSPYPTGAAGAQPLAQQLYELGVQRGEELCYWSYQTLPPPVKTYPNGTESQTYLEDGSVDEDIEWVKSYIDVTISRLRSLIAPGHVNTTVTGSMGTVGTELARRRCRNGRAEPGQCVPAITQQGADRLRWPLAIALFRVTAELQATVADWLGHGSLHLPQVVWSEAGGDTVHGVVAPWNGGGAAAPHGAVQPPGMPRGKPWPVSQVRGWGSNGGRFAKVVPCRQIPVKFWRSDELYYDGHIAEGANMTTANEGYAVWRSLCSVFPVTSAAACGAAPPPPAPRTPRPPATPAPDAGKYKCQLCGHVYDAAADGGGTPFADLPDTWVCPVCGAPRSAYTRQPGSAGWAH